VRELAVARLSFRYCFFLSGSIIGANGFGLRTSSSGPKGGATPPCMEDACAPLDDVPGHERARYSCDRRRNYQEVDGDVEDVCYAFSRLAHEFVRCCRTRGCEKSLPGSKLYDLVPAEPILYAPMPWPSRSFMRRRIVPTGSTTSTLPVATRRASGLASATTSARSSRVSGRPQSDRQQPLNGASVVNSARAADRAPLLAFSRPRK
jgi:hypothetical protein